MKWWKPHNYAISKGIKWEISHIFPFLFTPFIHPPFDRDFKRMEHSPTFSVQVANSIWLKRRERGAKNRRGQKDQYGNMSPSNLLTIYRVVECFNLFTSLTNQQKKTRKSNKKFAHNNKSEARPTHKRQAAEGKQWHSPLWVLQVFDQHIYDHNQNNDSDNS